MSCRGMSCDVVSCHVMWCYVISCCVKAREAMRCHVMCSHVICCHLLRQWELVMRCGWLWGYVAWFEVANWEMMWWSALQSITGVTQYYKVLPSLRTTKNYAVLQSSFPYYKVLPRTTTYYKVSLPTTKNYSILFRTTKTTKSTSFCYILEKELIRTTKYYKSTRK